MDEIKIELDNWKDGDYINPDALLSAYNAVALLLEKVELLETELADLKATIGK